MNAKKLFRFDASLILPLLIASIPAFWLTPSANAQGTVVVPGVVDGVTVSPGDTIELGYEISIADPDNTPTTVSVTGATFQLIVACANGGSQTITINPAAQSFVIPGSSSAYFPSDTTFEGSTTAPSNLCGGQGGTESAVTLTANYGFTCHRNYQNSREPCCHKICFRHHHRHHHQGAWAVENFCQPYCIPEKPCASSEKGVCCKE